MINKSTLFSIIVHVSSIIIILFWSNQPLKKNVKLKNVKRMGNYHSFPLPKTSLMWTVNSLSYNDNNECVLKEIKYRMDITNSFRYYELCTKLNCGSYFKIERTLSYAAVVWSAYFAISTYHNSRLQNRLSIEAFHA